MIRRARPADRAAIEAIVGAAYSPYIARIGRPPGPMLDDFRALIEAGAVSILEDADHAAVAIVVLIPKADHLLLDNIAVDPDRQGQGFGRRLIRFAESEARRLGYRELGLYTHQLMTENLALYARIGFAETGRGRQDGYQRVFMCKKVDDFP